MTIREINLVPDEILYQRYVVRHIILWTGCLIFFTGLILGFYQYQVRMVFPRQRPTTTVADMHLQLGATMEEIKVTQKEIEGLSQQEGFIKKLNTTQPFSRLLNRLSIIMNEKTWLTKLTIDAGTAEERTASGMQLTGFSLSNDELGNFLTRLSEAPLFENVVLKYAKENQHAGSSQKRKTAARVIKFQIDVTIAH
jgi:Tfp pilus assembly protein PilN